MPTRKKKTAAAKVAEPIATETPVLVLRTCQSHGLSYGGFQHPLTVGEYVEAADWNSKPKCGHGIHGALWGEGDGGLFRWEADTVWMVYEVLPSEGLVEIDNAKCKFRRGKLVFCGDQPGATAFVAANGGAGRRIIGGTATAGYRGTATAGDRGTATAGDRGTATAGYRGTATAGDRGTATAGDSGTATAGDSGTATAGDSGTATAGDRGTATAGYRGTATAGDSGTATAGDSGTIIFKVWDSNASRWPRWRFSIAYTGEDGIVANKPYTIRDGRIVPVED
jgi:hypothetical protein